MTDEYDPDDKPPHISLGRSISHMFQRKADKPLTKTELREMLESAWKNTAEPQRKPK